MADKEDRKKLIIAFRTPQHALECMAEIRRQWPSYKCELRETTGAQAPALVGIFAIFAEAFRQDIYDMCLAMWQRFYPIG